VRAERLWLSHVQVPRPVGHTNYSVSYQLVGHCQTRDSSASIPILVLRNGVRLTLTRTWRDRVEWLLRPTSRHRSKREV
jgi:hypothetical protein